MKLTVVGLPIGNIEDISLRAVRTITESDMVICEDTRMFSNLWAKLIQLSKAEKLTVPLRFLNDFNEERMLPKILNDASSLEKVVLVSDAGMPLISDPGYKLIKSGIEMGWEIDVVPGPTAESAALAISGLPTDKYLFLGFLPKKPGKRNEVLRSLTEVWKIIPSSVVIYESPNRLNKLLGEIESALGSDVSLFIGCDLTKKSQKILRGRISQIIESLSSIKLKGEVTLVLNNRVSGR